MALPSPAEWRAIGCSVIGASHVRAGVVNQDALSLPEPRSGPPLLVAVADGHGSARYCRSDVGARMAVDVVTAIVQRCFVDERPAEAGPSVLKRSAEEDLPRELVAAWRKRVEGHLAESPLTAEELEAVGGDGVLAYGTTVLAVLVAADFILYLQLGDGAILAVGAGGEVRRPLPPDERLLGNETTSLAGPDAWRDARVAFQWLPADADDSAKAPPALILVATDGYPNSFRDPAGFDQVGSDLLGAARDHGVGYVERHLGEWLAEATQRGSGDDVTVAVLRRVEPEDPDGLRQHWWQTETAVRRLEVRTVLLRGDVDRLVADGPAAWRSSAGGCLHIALHFALVAAVCWLQWTRR